jgi:hypothetical protein
MTATPLADLLAKVPALNNPNEPITYQVDGDKLVAKWDIVRAKSLYPKEFTTIDKKFSVTVEFDEKKGTFTTKDHEKSSGMSIGAGGLSFGSDSFSGKKSEKSFSFELGGINKKEGEPVSPVLAWSFDTARIKGPLFAFLEQNGWTKRRGLFG